MSNKNIILDISIEKITTVQELPIILEGNPVKIVFENNEF